MSYEKLVENFKNRITGAILKTRLTLGRTTGYTYDSRNGQLSTVTDAANHTTQYQYNTANNQLTSVSSSGVTNNYVYANDRLSSINVNNGVHYRFYDAFGRSLSTDVGNGATFYPLVNLEYDEEKGLLTKQSYGNADFITYSYDSLDRITEISYNGSSDRVKKYYYGADGSVLNTTDFLANSRTRYVYDLSGRLTAAREYQGTAIHGNTLKSSARYTYQDQSNYLTGTEFTSALGTQRIGLTYGNKAQGQMPDQVYKVSWNGAEKLARSFDGLGRLTRSTVNGNLTTTYNYQNVGSNQTSTQLSSITTPNGTYAYTYDNVGNILSIVDRSTNTTTSYRYDSLNQLVRENDQKAGRTYTYTYQNGNITSKSEYAYTTGNLGTALDTITYTYGNDVWKDQLTNYDGKDITYDEIGNMLTFDGKTYSWEGRSLTGISGVASYSYNMDGQRIGKTVGSNTTEYNYNGSILAGQKTGNSILTLMYDENGNYFGFTSNGTAYYYIKNAQGDVVAIANGSGSIITTYRYDAWGKILEVSGNTSIGNTNPIWYRGYYYDAETGFYYLNSRYYDPEVGRFISPDTTDILGVDSDMYDKNLYAYCDNNPVIRKDAGGEFWTIASGALIGAVISAGIEFGMQLATGGNLDVGGIALAALGGAAGGALAATSLGYIGQVVGNAMISGASEAIAQYRSGNRDLGSIAVESGKMAAVGAISVYWGGKGIKAKGTPYRKSIDNLKSVQGNVSKAISNPKGYRHQINRAIKTHQVTTRTAVKSTSKSFAKASFFSNFVGKVKSFFGW